MKDLDLEMLEAVFRLMKAHGVSELQLEGLHAHMPQAMFVGAPTGATTPPTMPTRDVSITITPDGQVNVPEDFYAAT